VSIKRKAFCEFGAYAVNVLDPSAIVVMPLRTAGDLGQPIGQTVTIDFTKILKVTNTTEADFDAARVDALGVEPDGSNKHPSPAYPHIDGVNVLTVGPTFPPGPHVGGISYVRSRFYSEVRPVLDPTHEFWPQYTMRPYQIMTTATFDTSTSQLRRYHGFHAKVVGQTNGMWQLQIETRTVSVDLNDRSICDDPAGLQTEIQDPDHPGTVYTALTSASVINDEGAVFLALPFCAANELRQGKTPPGAGYAVASTGSDMFGKSVFKYCLSRSRKIDIVSTSREGIREELALHIAAMGDRTEYLDIIADAPGGDQVFGGHPLIDILDDETAERDDRLARLIRSRFTRCRLLGCYTALSAPARKRMLRLSNVLGMPVIGTMRAISWSDFDKYGFKEFQVINGVRSTILRSTEQMSRAGGFDESTEAQLAVGWFQAHWLRQFRQVPFEAEDVSQPLDQPAIEVPSSLFQFPLASTDQITIAPEATIVLQTESATIPAEVLVSGTLLRLRSRRHGPVYLNLPPGSPIREDVLAQLTRS
jgi:hypothetical protein